MGGGEQGRLPWHRAPTLAWLAAQGLGDAFADLLTKQPRCPREENKWEEAAVLRLDAFVEDERRTADALVTVPLTGFLLDRPWNEGPALSGLTCVEDWAEIPPHLASVCRGVPI